MNHDIHGKDDQSMGVILSVGRLAQTHNQKYQRRKPREERYLTP
jgi:hypothetical protein